MVMFQPIINVTMYSRTSMVNGAKIIRVFLRNGTPKIKCKRKWSKTKMKTLTIIAKKRNVNVITKGKQPKCVAHKS